MEQYSKIINGQPQFADFDPLGEDQRLGNRMVTWDGLKDFLTMLKAEIPRMGSDNELLTGANIYSYAFGQENINKGTHSTLIGYKNHLNEDEDEGVQFVFVLGNTNSIQKSESCYIFGHDNRCGNLGTTNDVYIFGKNLTCYNSAKRAQPLYLLGQYAQRDSNSGWGYSNMAIVIGGGTSSTDQGRKTVFALDYNGNISTPLTIGENSDRICVSFSPQEHVIEFHDVPTFLNGATFNAGSKTTFLGTVQYDSSSNVSFSSNAQFDANITLGGTNDKDSKIQDGLYGGDNLTKYIYYSHGLRHLLHPVLNNQAYWNVRDNQKNEQETTLHINYDNARDEDGWALGDWDQDRHLQKAYAPQNIHFHAGTQESWANIECGSINTHNKSIDCGRLTTQAATINSWIQASQYCLPSSMNAYGECYTTDDDTLSLSYTTAPSSNTVTFSLNNISLTPGLYWISFSVSLGSQASGSSSFISLIESTIYGQLLWITPVGTWDLTIGGVSTSSFEPEYNVSLSTLDGHPPTVCYKLKKGTVVGDIYTIQSATLHVAKILTINQED